MIARQFGVQFQEWARDTLPKQRTHHFRVKTVRTIEAHGLVLQVAKVLETENATQKSLIMKTYWLKNAANKCKCTDHPQRQGHHAESQSH